MSIREDVTSKIKGHVEHYGGQTGPVKISVPVPGGEVDCEVSNAGPVGASLHRLSGRVSRDNPSGGSTGGESVRKRGEKFAQKADYLIERLSLVEADDQAKRAQVRSTQPECDGETRRYYEAEIRDDSFEFGRYEATPGKPRRRVDADLTHEQLGRLAEDLASE